MEGANGDGKDGSLEVVWKESPVEKKLQPNGASSRQGHATELRGFVHSLITTPSPNKQNQARQRRPIDEGSSAGGISRHIVFSPEKKASDAPPTRTSTPPPHRSKRHKTGQEHEALLNVLQSLDEKYSDTPTRENQVAVNTSFDSPLTKESWDAIEELEFQATQKPAMSEENDSSVKGKNTIKGAVYDSPFSKEAWDAIDMLESKANQQLPMLHESNTKKTQHISPIGEVLSKPPATKQPVDYIRCMVLEIQTDARNRVHNIRALDDASDETISLLLQEDWFDTPIQVGDTFHFIFTSEPRIFSADNSNNYLVLHPDIQVSPTTVTSSMYCSRKAVIDQTLSMKRSSGVEGLIGTLKHELFQKALMSGLYSMQYLAEQTQEIIQSNALKLLECGLTTRTATDHLQSSFENINKWFHLVHNAGLSIKDQPSLRLRLRSVLSIEESLCSVKYGLKGKVDACIVFTTGDEREMECIWALELKTGKKNNIQDAGQLLMYTLLLDERYPGSARGLLLYLKDIESIVVNPVAAHLRNLILARNAHAAHLSKMKSTQIMPPLLKKVWDCSKCFVSSECMLQHAAMEGGNAAMSGVPELFETSTSHLTPREIKYFKKWIELLDWEARSNTNKFWLLDQNTCLTPLNAQPAVFADVKQNDRFIVSVESSSRTIFQVSTASAAEVNGASIRLNLFSPIPSAILQGLSVVGRDFHWRLDKDKTYSGLQAAKKNVLAMMLNPSGEKNRKLICQLQAPRFESMSVMNRLRQREEECGTASLSLWNDFNRLNSDQQQAIEQLLNAKDYSLILGMPGTGKTTAITVAVRVLLYLGHSVLVTSYTHAAVDNILTKLLEHNVSFLRVGGTKDLVDPRIRPFCLESQTYQSAEEIQEVMVQANLVGCTCLSTHHVLFSQRRFDVCIVDEASQITQPVLLGALQHANRFSLVGDHYQLPPLVVDIQAKTGGLDWSLFKSLTETHPEACTILGYQYRMNRHIMMLANRLTYNNKLKCGRNQEHFAENLILTRFFNLPQWISETLSATCGVTFLNTDSVGYFEQRNSTTGIINQVEAHLVLGLCQYLSSADVSILSPFRSQVAYLQSLTDAIEISTIDTYQGKDKKVVFVSFVRSNINKNVGDLLLDWRRINVALTRAKQKLVLVGSATTLTKSPVLKSLLDIVVQEKWMLNVPSTYKNDIPPLPEAKSRFVVSRATGDMEDVVVGIKPVANPVQSNRFPVSRNIMEE
ncbi:hypothetical protein AeNC1_007698 [Aphanomyces euteiches]|nr:hypothetical protein AeNC1_007698 [Aphanomyces euteiches]